MLKNAILAFFNAPGAAPVRTRLRRIKHLQCLIRGETSLSHTSRLFFNSLLDNVPERRNRRGIAAEAAPTRHAMVSGRGIVYTVPQGLPIDLTGARLGQRLQELDPAWVFI